MVKDTIDQFMWGYQSHFRGSVEYLANRVLEQIGAGEAASALLIGVSRPGRRVHHIVCVEPEDGGVPQTLFSGLEQAIEEAVPKHDMQRMHYSDEYSMREKPENIRRLVTKEKIEERLAVFDAEHNTVTLCGSAHPYEDYYVCPAIQVSARLFERFPPIRFDQTTEYQPSNLGFVETCLEAVLDEATDALVFPDAGRNLSRDMRSAEEVIAVAAVSFMRSVATLAGEFGGPDLYAAFNRIAALRYEGMDVSAQLVLTSDEVDAKQYLMRFATPVPLRESRWARKLFQMVTRDAVIVGDNAALYGLTLHATELLASSPKSFSVEFPDSRQWVLSCQSQKLLRVEGGVAHLPQELISKEAFTDLVRRIFEKSPQANPERLWRIFLSMQTQRRGHMVVVASDAAEEAERLALQGTRIDPTLLSDDLIERACRIDGTILVDPEGLCHAIGVILDGSANENCTPSRGARFNSAVRYVATKLSQRMAIVVSDDATIDVIPKLRPRVALAEIESALVAFEAATPDDYHKPRSFLDSHRFYLTAEQCERANAALRRLDDAPKKPNRAYLVTRPFSPHPEMNESYYV